MSAAASTSSTSDWPGTSPMSLRQAAIVLMTLDQEVAGLVMDRLDRGAMAAVTQQLAQLGSVSDQQRQAALQAFYQALHQPRTGQAGSGDGPLDDLVPFSDLARVDDARLQAGLGEVTLEELALALRMADRPVVRKVMRNLDRATAGLLEQRLDEQPPVRLSAIEAAQRRVLDAVLGGD